MVTTAGVNSSGFHVNIKKQKQNKTKQTNKQTLLILVTGTKLIIPLSRDVWGMHGDLIQSTDMACLKDYASILKDYASNIWYHRHTVNL